MRKQRIYELESAFAPSHQRGECLSERPEMLGSAPLRRIEHGLGCSDHLLSVRGLAGQFPKLADQDAQVNSELVGELYGALTRTQERQDAVIQLILQPRGEKGPLSSKHL
jgi:hypothetical protein